MKFVALFLSALAITLHLVHAQQKPREVPLGHIFPLSHGVSADVVALDDRTIALRNLNYDGQGPDAYFWINTSGDRPSITGQAIPDENGSTTPIKGYRNANIVLQLPAGKTLRDVKHFALYCRRFQENFGSIRVNYV